jgi:hypothetical protein
MGVFDIPDLNKIKIGDLKNMGFVMGYWGSPDWYTDYKTRDLRRRSNRRCHWRPTKKFYEWFDPDTKIVCYYFPKGFDGFVNWGAMGLDIWKKYNTEKRGLIVCYDDWDWGFRWDTICVEAKSITDFECTIMEAKKRYKKRLKSISI